MRFHVLWLAAAAVLAGCATYPGQPKVRQPYAMIQPVAPVQITNIDRVAAMDNKIDYASYAGPNWWNGDTRVEPGTHSIDVKFNDPRYIGSSKTLIEVREGLRYYVGVHPDRFYLFPEVVKVEPIEGYWEEHQR